MKAQNLLKSIIENLPRPKSVQFWTCSCGATNSDIVHTYCQFCGK
jgi:hypothetical protein